MAFVKKLNFECNDLGLNVDLLLTFDDQPIGDLYKKYYPSAFAVRKFGADGFYRSPVVYRSQLAFTKVIVDDVIQSASTEIPINVGQSTVLTLAEDVYHFSDPKTDASVPKNNIQCTNNAPFNEDIGVGFIVREGEAAKTTLVWRGVEHGQKLNAQFTPILRGYIGTQYKENSLIKGQIETKYCVFKQDLAKLEDNSTWVIKYDSLTGVISIDRK
ncbi:hypothetical protein DEU56DRAFT_979295 [Suillus clintonianus]|uniref:uncharacterized protein n=1 Tax=Suillus clintonianus TaxID=1904413 RepID=UPI001B87A1E9|nr:uncharacterized protein DEU56DRAFT_979295 [Suillus clintonianus]KAG2143604.1 hypothetical protein DEU56DRAFT_979295 [Suillus clintonianus]